MRVHLLAIGVLALVALARPVFGTTYYFPAEPLPATLVAGDVLNVSAQSGFGSSVSGAAGSTANFFPGGGIFALNTQGWVNFAAGSSGVSSLTVSGGTVLAGGGLIGQRADLNNGAFAWVHGGNFFAGMRLTGSTVDFLSGHIGGVELHDNSVLNIYGYGVVSEVDVFEGQVNLRGGGFGLHSMAPPNAIILAVHDRLNVFVRSATLGGAAIPGLTVGSTVTIADRGVNLDTVLADGTPFSIPLTLAADPGNYDFYGTSVVTVTLVPEPGTATLGLIAAAALMRGAAAQWRPRRSR